MKFSNQTNVSFADDFDDGFASAVDNGAAKNDERSRNKTWNGANAAKHECPEPG